MAVYQCQCATPSKTPDVITTSTEPPSKSETSRSSVHSYMSTKNGGGDPVSALALRSESSSQSAAERQAKVQREMAASLKQYRTS
ncbi:uncharacterized protein PG986_008632 [Apiospora aurea]|uniref:Uncharacterized protein n=1 Tax=Apiospora aurea TaxID=335848 RepID=A0ABR1Q5B9_9PEZI